MGQVQKLEFYHLEIPYPRALQSHLWRGSRQHTHCVDILRVWTEDGLEGVAGVGAVGRERQGQGALLERLLLGLRIDDLAGLSMRLREVMHWGCHLEWVEPVLWDLRGKRAGLPLYRLLAPEKGEVSEVSVYCSTLERQEADTRLASMDAIFSGGYQALRLSLLHDIAEDVRLLQEIRRRYGEDFPLMLNVDQGYRAWGVEPPPPGWKLAVALDYLAAVEPFRLEWIEDIADTYAYDDLSVLRCESEVPIAGGQKNTGWHEFKIFFEKGSLDIYMPDATMAGGIETTAQVMDACFQRDLHFSPSPSPNGFSVQTNLHLYAAWPRKYLFAYPFEPEVLPPHIRDVGLQRPLIVQDGKLRVPQEPGLGISLDLDQLERYGVCWHRAEID